MEYEQTPANIWDTTAPANALHLEQPQISQFQQFRQDATFADLQDRFTQLKADNLNFILEVRKNFTFPESPSVIDFLKTHRTVPSLLMESVSHLKRHFGPNSLLSLRAPIDESGSPTLYAVIMWPGRSQDARDALERFDESWWLPISKQASGNLYFTYELV